MTSLQEVYVSVKGLIATNLSTMGVTGYSSSDGLTTLANAILEVEGGSDLTISLDLVSSSSSIQSGQTVNLTATLSATFNGETVDLNSVLQNAPITFKEGNTTINTVSTNANGVATISNYAPVGTGTVTLSAQFPTTDGFDGATDVITITVEDVSPVATTLALTADKPILSYADSESATLSATLLDQYDDPMSGETITFKKGGTVFGTGTTNVNGVATCNNTYASQGVGDVSFTAEVGSLVSEIFALQDCFFYDSQTVDKSRYSTSSGNITYNSDGCSVVGTDNNNCAIVENTVLTLPNSDYSLECTIGDYTTTTSGSTTYKGGIIIDNSFIDVEGSRVVVYQLSPLTVKQVIGSKTANVGDIFKIVRDGGSLKYYLNNTLLTTQTISSTGKFGYRSCVNRGLRIKDIKVKALPSETITLNADKSILSYADSESATLTATYSEGTGATVQLYDDSDDSLIGTMTDNLDGTYSYTYASTGVGDVSFYAKVGSLVSETYSIVDAWKHISSGSYTGTSSISFQELYESSVYDNIEISATIKAPNKGFGLAFLKSKDSSSSIQDNIFAIGVDGGNYLAVARIENGNSTVYTSSLFQQYTANSDLNCVIRIENGVVTLKLNNYTYTSTPITGLKYVGVRNWNSAKTVTYTDFIVKPL